MAENGNCLNYAILLTSGVTCLLVLFDLASRYLSDKKQPPSDDVTDRASFSVAEPKTEVGFEALANEQNEEVIAKQEIKGLGQGLDVETFATSPDEETYQEEVEEEIVPEKRVTCEAKSPLPVPEKPEVQTSTDLTRGLLDDLVNTLRTNTCNVADIENLSEDCQKALNSVTALQPPCNDLSVEFDKTSVTLSGADQPRVTDDSLEDGAGNDADKSQSSLADFMQQRNAVRDKWMSTRKLLFCADLHLRNAANYHQFHSEAKEADRGLQCLLEEITQNLESQNLPDDAADVNDVLSDLSDMRNSVLVWGAILRDLVMRSYSVVPVHMRVDDVEDPLPVQAVCSYTNNSVSVQEGDFVTLLSNQNRSGWKVKTTSGEEGELPAVCCLIPPPDASAVEAAGQLASVMTKIYNTSKEWVGVCLIGLLKATLTRFLNEKDQYFTGVGEENKKELQQLLDAVSVAMDTTFKDQTGSDAVSDLSVELAQIVARASDDVEHEKLRDNVIDVLANIMKLLKIHGNLEKSQNEFNDDSCHLAKTGSTSENEWEVVDGMSSGSEQGVDISVERSTTETAAARMTSAQGEVRQTFAIGAVVDLRDNSEISMTDAIARGIIKPDEGMYHNLVSGECYPIPVAMSAGHILVESTQTKNIAESAQSVGLISVKITRETKPYSVQKVLDPETQEMIWVAEATERGIFFPETGCYKNIATGVELSIQEAIDTGCLVVTYDEDMSSEPEVVTQHFAVDKVLKKSTGAFVKFNEASAQGLIDDGDGSFTDDVTGGKTDFMAAYRSGLVKASIVKDPDHLGSILMTRKMSISSESSTSSK